MEDIKKITAARMRAVLQKSNLDQEAAAQLLGITQPGLNNYLTGKRAPKADFIQKFCNIFKISPNYLLGFDDDTAEPTSSSDSIDREIIQTIICKITEWEQKNGFEYGFEAKADLIKLIYDRIAGLGEEKQDAEAAKIIDIYQYIKGAS